MTEKEREALLIKIDTYLDEVSGDIGELVFQENDPIVKFHLVVRAGEALSDLRELIINVI